MPAEAPRKTPFARSWLIIPLLLLSPSLGRSAEPSADEQTETDSPSDERLQVSTDAASSLYVRSDSDGTTVIAPRVSFRQGFGRTGLTFIHTADVWTSASVDIRTAATESVTERRDEIGVGVDHERGTWLLGAYYRVSREHDYWAHGPSLSAAWEGLQRNVRLEGRVSMSDDIVGQSGNPEFRRSLRSFAGSLGYTQVLGRTTVLQLSGEHRTSLGYHASPYRWVGLGGPVQCAAETALCMPEVVPDRRHRYAVAARLRQAVAPWASLGLGYRYYVDSWLLQSHTASGDLRFVPHRDVMLDLEYRAYFQGAASFYRSSYAADPAPRFVTRDRELSSMYDHAVAALLHWTHAFPSSVELDLGVRLAMLLYGYDDFPGLDRVLAGEGTLNLRIGVR